jgi:hypothetical protein
MRRSFLVTLLAGFLGAALFYVLLPFFKFAFALTVGLVYDYSADLFFYVIIAAVAIFLYSVAESAFTSVPPSTPKTSPPDSSAPRRSAR